jgi:hypothetical protein
MACTFSSPPLRSLVEEGAAEITINLADQKNSIMKTPLFCCALTLLSIGANAQCHYLPATVTTTDTLTYNFSGGALSSNGCAPIDPTYWMAGGAASATVNFVAPQNNPSFRVWGMNDDDSAAVTVNGVNYPLNATTASYSPKVVCGTSPGADGVAFANGKLVGTNTNTQGNFSYQDVQLNVANVSMMTISSVSGAGWGFAGVSVNCPTQTGIAVPTALGGLVAYPSPFSQSTTIRLDSYAVGAELVMYNHYGQIVRSIHPTGGNGIILDRDGLPAGIYFIRLMQGSHLLADGKIVIVD